MLLSKEEIKSTAAFLVATNMNQRVGLLFTNVYRDVFASPSACRVYGAMKALPSKKGTILLITNCCVFPSFPGVLSLHRVADAGDSLYFGLACQQARADGIENANILPVGDDVSGQIDWCTRQ